MMVHFSHAHIIYTKEDSSCKTDLFMTGIEPASVRNNAIDYSLTVISGPRMPFSIRCGLTCWCFTMLPLLHAEGVLMTTNDF